MKNFSEAMDIADSLTTEVKLLINPIGSVKTKCWINSKREVDAVIGAPMVVTQQVRPMHGLRVEVQIQRTHPEAVELELYIDGIEVLKKHSHFANPPTRYIDTNDAWILDIAHISSWMHEIQGHGEIY